MADNKHLFRPEQVANTFIILAVDQKVKDLTPLKLIKLVYAFYAWYLFFNNKERPFSERPEAWRFGPVFPSLYREFGQYRRKNLGAEHLAVNNFLHDDFDVDSLDILTIDGKKEEKAFRILLAVWEQYKDKSGKRISDITHREGSAWDKAQQRGGYYSVMDDEEIVKSAEKGILKRFPSLKG